MSSLPVTSSPLLLSLGIDDISILATTALSRTAVGRLGLTKLIEMHIHCLWKSFQAASFSIEGKHLVVIIRYGVCVISFSKSKLTLCASALCL